MEPIKDYTRITIVPVGYVAILITSIVALGTNNPPVSSVQVTTNYEVWKMPVWPPIGFIPRHSSAYTFVLLHATIRTFQTVDDNFNKSQCNFTAIPSAKGNGVIIDPRCRSREVDAIQIWGRLVRNQYYTGNFTTILPVVSVYIGPYQQSPPALESFVKGTVNGKVGRGKHAYLEIEPMRINDNPLAFKITSSYVWDAIGEYTTQYNDSVLVSVQFRDYTIQARDVVHQVVFLRRLIILNSNLWGLLTPASIVLGGLLLMEKILCEKVPLRTNLSTTQQIMLMMVGFTHGLYLTPNQYQWDRIIKWIYFVSRWIITLAVVACFGVMAFLRDEPLGDVLL